VCFGKLNIVFLIVLHFDKTAN